MEGSEGTWWVLVFYSQLNEFEGDILATNMGIIRNNTVLDGTINNRDYNSGNGDNMDV